MPFQTRLNPALLVTLGWVALMVYLASLSRLPRVPVIPRGAEGALGHLGSHAVLALLLYAVLHGLATTPLRRLMTAGVVLGASFVIGTGLELMQLYLIDARAFELQDILLNTIGAGAGVIAGMTLQMIGLRGRWLGSAASAPALVLGAGIVASVVVWNPALPRVGDHWHSPYFVRICGETLDPFPGTVGGIHTHGGRLIHVHPRFPAEAGRDATLATFFETAGGELTATSITLPSGERYENGDPCPDGAPGHLHVTLFDRETPLEEPHRHVIRRLDLVYIQFGPAPEPPETFVDDRFRW